MVKQKIETLEICRDEMFNNLFEKYIEHFESDAKDLVLNGTKFKGLNNMSDKELRSVYKDVFDIKGEIKISR